MFYRLYLDCDGVLADFDSAFIKLFGRGSKEYEDTHGSEKFWKDLYNTEHLFYRKLELMSDARLLFNAVKIVRPIILTGCPKGEWAEIQKIQWAAEHFPGTPIVTCRSKDKSMYCKPGDILIDDRDQYRHLWEEKGGIFIHHKNAEQSIKELHEMRYE